MLSNDVVLMSNVDTPDKKLELGVYNRMRLGHFTNLFDNSLYTSPVFGWSRLTGYLDCNLISGKMGTSALDRI